MKNLTLAIIALVVLGFASLGFTMIEGQSPKSEVKGSAVSTEKMVSEMSQSDQVQGRKEGKELASFD
ncbi:hypothetical protein [Daejeonella oryzae]|uniref:hypothetical protein n=1 Tax=Daejeonella oryzae TaxID=1122943 RepID=UPI0003F99A50|nr:hypothetical protein [Daejeonella oryzae]